MIRLNGNLDFLTLDNIIQLLYIYCMQTQTINLSIPKPLLAMINRQAKAEARTKSGLIQEAVRSYLSRQNAWNEIFAYGQKQAKKLGYKPTDVERLVDDYRRKNTLTANCVCYCSPK